ncbi:MAG: hypothetical protein HYR74_01310 [Candidatus Eisenbacteria bacterium]|nr:hypothetical protein [Candidatus Eisenbacteria bacterium]
MIRTLDAPMTRVERAALFGGWALALALMWPLRGYLTDDTFIHLQYARHLATGHGLVFNTGERVYGCTSPLWVTLLADAITLGIDGLTAARALGVAAALASIALFLQLLRRTVTLPVVRAAGTIAWASNAWMLRWSTSGMETTLAVALVLAGFVAFTEGRQLGARPVRTGTLWALAAMTRPEAVFLLLLWGMFLLIDAESREGLQRLVFGSLAPVAVYGSWLLFARFYYGTFWPQTLAAKSAGGVGLAYHLANLWREARIVAATDGLLVALLIAALVFGGRRVWSGGGAKQRLVPWAWVLALPVLYTVRGVPVLSRYLVPLLPVLAWLAWRAAERWWMGDEPTPARRRVTGILAVTVAGAIVAQNLFVYRTQVVPHVRSFSPALEKSLIAWGRWFGRTTAPSAVIATPDIGAIGYFSGRRIVDLAGLVTPAMVTHLARETPEEAIAGFHFATFSRPDYLVDRAASPYLLMRTSPWAATLTPLGVARVPNLGLARPNAAFYSFYRVSWPVFDSLRAARAARPAPLSSAAPRPAH